MSRPLHSLMESASGENISYICFVTMYVVANRMKFSRKRSVCCGLGSEVVLNSVACFFQ